MPDGSAVTLRLELHPKQLELRDSPATEILYGGAAGGGKSHALRCLAILWAWAFPGLQVYLFRRISEDLTKNHVEGPKGFRALLADWVREGLVEIVEGEIRFKFNGSRIFLCHCHEEKDRFKYQGAEIHVLLIDELTHFTEVIYRFLRSRVRMVGMNLPEQIRLRFPRIIAGSNPGNIGHEWVKRAFIDGHAPGEAWRAPDEDGGMVRQFIPARLGDNPSLLVDDPGYRAKLKGLGSAALVKAMEEGDWNAIEGAYFDCWDTARHVCRPFPIPLHWTRFRSFDWGSYRPFSTGWWAVATEDYALEDGRTLPRGGLVRYREWYGASAPNVGLKLHAPDVARGILLREAMGGDGIPPESQLIRYSVADPSAFRQDGGPSIAEEMAKHGVIFRPGDNTRIAGAQQVRKRLVGDEEGRAMLICFDTCVDSIRTIPALMHDEHRPEDVDSDGEDHAYDEWRYGCMSRPWMSDAPKQIEPINTRLPTLGELTDRHVAQWQSRSSRI